MARYQSILAVGPPIDVGTEQGTNRRIFTINFNCRIDNPSSTLQEEIAKYLEDNSYGTRAVTIFWGAGAKVPSSTGNEVIVVIVATGGAFTLMTRGSSGTKTDRPNFQITCLSKSADACYSRAHEIFNLLDRTYNVTLAA